MDEKVQAALERLSGYRANHMELGKRIFSEGGGLYTLDFLAIATLNRSLMLMSGFCTLIKARNFISATPLIRLQLDNCLRFSAAGLVKDSHKFALDVINGVQISKQKDRDGALMTDSYLLKKVAHHAPWISQVYEHTSGYVHLSEKHIFSAIRPEDEREGFGIFTGTISEQDRFVSDDLYLEAVEAFQAITDLLFEYLDDWVAEKGGQATQI